MGSRSRKPADPDSPQGLGDSACAAAPTVGPGSPHSHGSLDRRTILLAAVTLIDENDLRHLTMRNLGLQPRGGSDVAVPLRARPGRPPRRHRGTRHRRPLRRDPDVYLSADAWQDCLQRLAHGVRRIALAPPAGVPAHRDPAARRALGAATAAEPAVDGIVPGHPARTAGSPTAAASGAYRSFSSFLLGHLLLEVSGQGADIGPIEQADPDDKPTTDLIQYPRLQNLETELSQDHSADEFEEALETLLERIDLLEHHPSRGRRRR